MFAGNCDLSWGWGIGNGPSATAWSLHTYVGFWTSLLVCRGFHAVVRWLVVVAASLVLAIAALLLVSAPDPLRRIEGDGHVHPSSLTVFLRRRSLALRRGAVDAQTVRQEAFSDSHWSFPSSSTFICSSQNVPALRPL